MGFAILTDFRKMNDHSCLDLKYRPQNYSEVIGNAGPVSILQKRSDSGVLLKRSILLGGPKGCGKTSLARIIARSCICHHKVEGNPCNVCGDCLDIINENSTSVFEFDAAAHGTVDRIRTIVDNLDYANFDGNPTILILDEAHRLSTASQDALLKSMEDRRIFCILCTTEPNKIRAAVRDRVDEYPIRPATHDDLVGLLRRICETEGVIYSIEALSEIVSNSDRSPRSSINVLQSIMFTDDVSVPSVHKYYRYDSLKIIRDSLSLLMDKTSYCLQEITPVFESESSIWIRDSMVKVISQSVRKTLGIPVILNIPTFSFGQSDVGFWTNISKSLGVIDKPTIYDIEAILLSAVRPLNAQVVYVNPSVKESPQVIDKPASVTLPSAPKPKEILKPGKKIEINGVTFSAEESLTSIDDKIGPSRGPVGPESSNAPVEFETDKIPMSVQEFSRVFTEKLTK